LRFQNSRSGGYFRRALLFDTLRPLGRSAVLRGHLDEFLKTAGVHCGADQFVLALKALSQSRFVDGSAIFFAIGNTLARKDSASVVHERQDKRRGGALILSLNVVYDAVVFDVCIETCDHSKMNEI
jgi:hypothetical protein